MTAFLRYRVELCATGSKPRTFLVSIDLISSFVVGISGGDTQRTEADFQSVGITSSRPAISPQIVTGFPGSLGNDDAEQSKH